MPWRTPPPKAKCRHPNSPEDLHEYVRTALDQNAALTSLIDAEVGYSLLVYEVTIVDRDWHRSDFQRLFSSRTPGAPAPAAQPAASTPVSSGSSA